MHSALSLRLVAHRGIQRSRNVFIIIIIIASSCSSTHLLQIVATGCAFQQCRRDSIVCDRVTPFEEGFTPRTKLGCVNENVIKEMVILPNLDRCS